MLYLSQLLDQPVYSHGKPFGKIVDMAIFENRPHPPISKIEIKKNKERFTVSPQALAVENNHLVIKTQQVPMLPFDKNDFYLAEDLLDKQVIDVDGKKLVRVNDVLLEADGEMKVVGIDVGVGGILRRLGVTLNVPTKVLPWTMIEAFDYQTGSIKLKLKQNSLNALHPADLADILEEAGSRERLGIVSALDPKQAARVIEETDDQTQISILGQLPQSRFKEIINKMHLSEIADVFRYLNPLKTRDIQMTLGEDRNKRLAKLLHFSDNVAGGLMNISFMRVDAGKTVKEVIKILLEDKVIPETIVVTNGNEKIVGIVYTKDLLGLDSLALLKDVVADRKFVYQDTDLTHIIQLFSRYNLRLLPVVDKDKKPVGVIGIDDLLRIIENNQEADENI